MSYQSVPIRSMRTARSLASSAAVVLALLAGPVSLAEAQSFWELVCTISDVEVNGVASVNEDIKPGDQLFEHVPIPPPGTPPTFEGDLEGGGKGAGWDLNEQAGCTHVTPEGETNGGQAGASRVISENGTTDALAADSIGYVFSLGFINIGRCGFGLRDEDGETLDTHDVLPETIDLSDWSQRECFIQGTHSVTQEEVLARGRIKVFGQGTDSPEKSLLVYVTGGDEEALVDAIEFANLQPSDVTTFIEVLGDEDFVITEGYQGTENAFPIITSNVILNLRGAIRRGAASVGPLRLAQVSEGSLKLFGRFDQRSEISGFSSSGNGGTLLVEGNSELVLTHLNFRDGFSGGDGSAVWIGGSAEFRIRNTDFEDHAGEANGTLAVTESANGSINDCNFNDNTVEGEGGGLFRGGSSSILVELCEFNRNMAGTRGGAVAIRGDAIDPAGDDAPVILKFNQFNRNGAGDEGCDAHINVAPGNSGEYQVDILFNIFEGTCTRARVTHYQGRTQLLYNTLEVENNDAALRTAFPQTDFQGTVLQRRIIPQLQTSSTQAHKPQSLCENQGDGAFNSQGWNISSDDSCSLDQASDLPDTDAMLSADEGAPTPLPGSPAIDHGPAGLLIQEGDSKPSLPCGYRDVTGLGRPQDGDGDGGFECDSGAVEAPGAGAVVAGHSAAFYNALRNGEGQYVEILDGGAAVIYTFTYRPDGSGPAWLVGVASVAGNSLVADALDRPVGTSFGASFEADDIDFSDWGGMSMVFPDCEAIGTPGNAAYSGSPELGYEALITQAERITDIAGCGSQQPHANAGLSGSWYDPERNGEGLVIQWLPDGSVLAIMFTYDTNGKQMWIFGVGQSDGKTVTIDAIYPTGFTSWGGAFDTNEVVLEPWGRFTLTWTDCNTLAFEYTSEVAGYGSATRNYNRLTSLSGLTCPGFE